MPAQQLPENGAVNGHNFPSNFKRQKMDNVRDFLAGIPAVPLRSLPSVEMEKEDPEKSHGKNVDAEQKMANGNENGVGSKDEAWKRDLEKAEAVIAQAKEFIRTFENKFSKYGKGNSNSTSGKWNAHELNEIVDSNVDECVSVEDISKGKENFPIRAMNKLDDTKPPPFTYIANIVYPNWCTLVEPIACDCTDGCSDSLPCACVLKNGGEIPYNEEGCIIRAKRRVHECGPLCKCPPSCMNRVSQNGPHRQLEIFKTENRGWGVRSRDYISSGSFICEYVGELLRDTEAELRVGHDEYLFDICKDGYAIDARAYGNIGRFINHSCSPNMYGQEVLFDHGDKRMPHIMFFATENIPPLQELLYDYSYKKDRVLDANGNIKKKACYCGSRKCTGRMY